MRSKLHWLTYHNKVRGLKIFFVTLAIIFVVMGAAYYWARYLILNNAEEDVSTSNNNYAWLCQNYIGAIASDLIILEDVIVADTFNSDTGINEEQQKRLEEIFIRVEKDHKDYDQIRVLNPEGQEIVRVNNGDVPTATATNDLQDKSSKYYYKAASKLKDYGVYLSPIDLNEENGEVEYVDGVAKPTFRIATPMYNTKGDLTGILIINYRCDNLNSIIGYLNIEKYSSLDIVNQEGYYLYSGKDVVLFGNLYPGEEDATYMNNHPIDMEAATKQQDYIENIDKQVFLSTRISTKEISDSITLNVGREVEIVSDLEDIYVISNIKYSEIEQYQLLNMIALIALITGIFVAHIISLFVENNKHIQSKYVKILEKSSNYDHLTGLPNRMMVFQLLNNYHDNDTGYVLFFMDLDGFKKINDTYGHDAGDIALIEAGKRFQSCVREHDIVARIGGDEFLVVLPGDPQEERIREIAGAIVTEISKDLLIEGEICHYSVSIGISRSRADATTDKVVEEADEAMYQVKNGQKNGYVFYDPEVTPHI